MLPVFTQGLAKIVKDRGTVTNAIIDVRLKETPKYGSCILLLKYYSRDIVVMSCGQICQCEPECCKLFFSFVDRFELYWQLRFIFNNSRCSQQAAMWATVWKTEADSWQGTTADIGWLYVVSAAFTRKRAWWCYIFTSYPTSPFTPSRKKDWRLVLSVACEIWDSHWDVGEDSRPLDLNTLSTSQ